MSVTDGERAASQDGKSYVLQIYARLSLDTAPCCTLRVHKEVTAAAVVKDAAATLGLDTSKFYVLAEVKECGGEEWILEASDLPVQRVLLWPRKAQEQHPQSEGFYFLLQQRNEDGSIHYVHLSNLSEEREVQRLAARGFLPPQQEDFDDLCNLPRLTVSSILDNLRNRFQKKKIYTYAGSILIAINPFKFLPIYNPKYVKMYENHQLGKLEPHIFAIADVAYYAMLRKGMNQCIVISGESGSGKTQSTNFLIHCLTALSQKGYASGVERTILGAGPVLEAFGNAKTAHNNNSSRFGKFIQVNYLESGIVRGAVVEKYLLEKSRLVSREKNERNYHVFYYLLVGASEDERKEFKLLQPEDYFYLKQQNFKIEDEEDLRHDFERLQQAMEMVGFLPATKKQIFSVLSAILYLGNVTYRRKSTGREEGLDVGPPEVLTTLSDLLKVKEEELVEALTKRKTVTANDKLILPYSHSEAITARDSMAKSLYSALFDWIVLRINHALLNKKDMEESVKCLSIGVLDIFGFEDFETNSFEQFCINYANEQLHYYFNQHIFKLEQEEYKAEGITWHNIDYTDNVGCIHLISKKPTGLFFLLDEESNFPHATDKTLLAKFKQQHQGNKYFVPTPVLEPAFVIQHFAGNVKYHIKDFREKNTDHMRPDIVALLRSSERAYVRELVGMDPVAMFRWAILRATIRGMAAFNEAGRQWAAKTAGMGVSRSPLTELQRSNTVVEKIYRDMHAQIINSIKDLQLDGEDPRKLLQSWGRLRYPRHLLQKNKNTKQKQIIPKSLIDSRSLKFIVGLTLYDRTTKSLLHLHKKKKPPSISAQFQTSLSKLLETLGKAEPFFIRCIRSNAEKREMCFDESLVLQQLRYTGMLETVRIRRSGYSAKYTFQEFIEHFRVLLPKNATASQDDVSALLQKTVKDNTMYQIGKSKVFLKELVRQQLQDTLHKDVMCKIIFLQRWFRAKLERKHFLSMRKAAIIIQRFWRRSQESRCKAAIVIQAAWRAFQQRALYLQQQACIKKIQALVRGNLARRRHGGSVPAAAVYEKVGEIQAAESYSLNKECKENEAAELPCEKPTMASLSQSEEELNEPKRSFVSQPEEKPRPLPLHRTTGSRSQEKREQRRQRGLEHSKRECQRAASASKEEPTPKVKGQDAVTGPEARQKERADSKELDQYTFVAWKMKEEKGKKEVKASASPPSRPSSLPLRTSVHKPSRNGFEESPCAKHSEQDIVKEKAEKWKEKSSEGGHPDISSPEADTCDNRGTATSLYGFPAFHTSRCLGLNNHCPPAAFPASHQSRPQQHASTSGSRGRQNPPIKISRATRVSGQWHTSLDRKISNANELRQLDEFLGNQVPEIVLICSRKHFLPSPSALMTNYQNMVVTLAGEKQKSEVQLVVNLFQSVLDIFIRLEIKKEEAEPVKLTKARKKRRKKEKSLESPLDHMFDTYQVNIMQSCDQCSSYIWGMETAYMCSSCKMVCHKKCISKIVTDCYTFGAKKTEEEPGSQNFGVRVCALISDKNPVPIVLEMMLEHVEMNGLYTEGIYRKSGALYFKTIQWLRELPDPLMTFTHYSEFIRAVELPEKLEQLHAIYKVLEQLPAAHFNTLERLVYHLVKVAKEEAHNRMSPNALAIVFAPCILRCPDTADPLMSMKDVAKTTMCVEMLINEQTRRYNEKMEEIVQLEFAEELAVNQLQIRRQNTRCYLPLRFSSPCKGVVVCIDGGLGLNGAVCEEQPTDLDREAEKSLLERIKSIKQEKVDLACRLPELEQPGSDQENLDSEASVSSESLIKVQLSPFISCISTPLFFFFIFAAHSALYSTRLQLERRNPVIPSTVRLPPGVFSRTASHALPTSTAQALLHLRRRDPPSRRKDSTQSLYIAPGLEPFPVSLSSSTPNNFQPIPQVTRRFSDPDIPHTSENV
uniref:Myosin IXB n=1 Tax=Scleropages formosus TaxID=113540 RepID=A0A8C9R980_SCLFO